MNRTLSFLVILALLFTASACGGKKPPDPSAVKTKSVLAVLRDMSASYEKKKLDSFMSSVSDDYRGREAFSNALAAVFAKYPAIRFNIQYAKMLVMIREKGQIRASFNWDAEWLASGGTSQKGDGRATFAFEPDKFKLVSIDGKNPFIPTGKTVK